MIFLFLIPHFLLLSSPDWISAALCAVICLIVGALLSRFSKESYHFPQIYFPLLSAGAAFLLGAVFYLHWQHFGLFTALESLPKVPAKRICGIVAAALAALSLWGTDAILCALCHWILKKDAVPHQTNEYVLLGMASAEIMTLISRCSPFHAFNDWVDPHTMFTVGKSILHGMVPYRDVFEQKGPIILFLHSLGAWISFDSFRGVWLIEIVSCFFFLLISWHIIRIRLGKKALPFLPLIALIVFSAASFDQGDSAEEFCIPLMAYTLLVGYRALENRRLPSRREWILIGVTSGCVLWTKFSILGFYLGWFLAVFLFARNEQRVKEVLQGILWITLGVCIVTLPILIWFAAKGAFPQLFEVYFYQNMFLYPKTADMFGNFALHKNLGNGLLNFAFYSTVIFIFSVLGLVWVSGNEDKSVLRLVLYSFVALFLVLYFSGRFYTYYSLIFGLFVPFGICWLVDLVDKFQPFEVIMQKYPEMLCSAGLCLTVLGTFLASGNMRSLYLEKEDFPQYQAKALIEASGIEKPTLLNYQFLDMGVNQIAGILPNQRFFCGFNLPLNEIAVEQNACLASGCTDFVLTFMMEIDSPNYRLLEKFPATYSVGPITPTYNLYQKAVP